MRHGGWKRRERQRGVREGREPSLLGLSFEGNSLSRPISVLFSIA